MTATAAHSRRRRSRRETRAAFAFLSPWLIGFVVFTLGPMIASLVLSFTDYDGISSPKSVGLANYRKTHLFGEFEADHFTAGDTPVVQARLAGLTVGLLICYDVEFPETVRLLALQGADAVLVPTANMVPFDEVQRILLPARALENRLFLAYANACGREGGLHYNGLSQVNAPDGSATAQAGAGETQLRATLQASARTATPAAQLQDRRSDLCGPLAQSQR